jgi:hypothetical protein
LTFKTYSFQDIDISINHPSVGSFSANGEGTGSIAVNMANDKTVHDLAADGTVMITKVKTRSGTMAVVVQQSSGVNNFLTKLSNFLDSAPASDWALTNITIRSKATKEIITGTGVSPQKIADKNFQATGQNYTWNLMCADIQHAAL